MDQLMEHLRGIESGKQTNSRVLRTFQERHRADRKGGATSDVDTVDARINPNDIYSLLSQAKKTPQTDKTAPAKKTATHKTAQRRSAAPPTIVAPLDVRRELLHAEMAQLLVRPPQLTSASIAPPPVSPPKTVHSRSKATVSSIDNALQTQLRREQTVESTALKQASDNVAATLAAAQDLIPLSFLLERNMKAMCQSKAGAVIQAAFQTFLLHFYADAWQHWRAFVVASRQADRVAAASLLARVYRGHRARKACVALRAQVAALDKLKATAVVAIVTRRANAAINIQMCFRRHRLQVRKQQVAARHAAATRIQRLTVYNKQRAMALAKMLVDARKIHAALMLQKLWRGHCGRRQAARRKVQVRHAKRLEKMSQPELAIAHRFEAQGAVFRIQGQARRWLRRRRGREARVAIREARAKEKMRLLLVRFILRFKRRQRLRQHAADHAVRTKAARLIQRCILQWIQRRKWKLLRMARRKQERQARLALKASRMQRAPRDKVKLPFRAASTAWKSLTRTIRGDKKNPKDVAATCIQRAWRCANKRHQVYLKTLYTKLDKAAEKRQAMHRHVTRIQKLWRGRRDRKKCRFLWLDKVTRHALAKWKRRRAIRRDAAATKIQTKYRVVRAKVVSRAVEELLRRQHAAAKRVQRLVRCRQAVQKVQRQRDQCRRRDEVLRFCQVSLERCVKLRLDFLVIQSLEGNMSDLVKYPIWVQEQGRFHRGDTSFPIFQILFVDYSGLKRDLWATQTAKTFAAVRLDRSKFVKIFREAFATSDRLMDITSEADRVLAKLKAHPLQSRTSLAFPDFVFGIKEMAKLQIKSKKIVDDDAKVLQLFWKHLAVSKWSKKSKGPDEMRAYTLAWMDDQARCIQQMARRKQYQERGYILMDLKRKEWQEMRAHAAARTIQSLWRTKASRAYMRKLMQAVFRKYIDAATGLPYWTNPRTGYSTWKKPSILGKGDVDSPAIPMADDATEFAIQCENCRIQPVQEMCFQCDDKYCFDCFSLLHAKGKMATHQHVRIPTCVACLYQVATRYCSACKENYCDNCMAYLHTKGTMVDHVAAPLMLLCVDCLGKRAVRVHCHTCNKDVCKACVQYHPPEYCHTEPRPFESFPVENERKRLDMIKTNEIFAEEKRIQDAKGFEALKVKCAVRIQRGWRRKVNCKTGMMRMFELHKAQQSNWDKIRRDRQREKQFVYRVKGVFGKAEPLETDSATQKILRRLNVFTRHKVEARARALNVALDEYVHLGVLLPGMASIAEGSDQLETSEDLRGWLVPGQALRIEGHVVYAQAVESIGETFVQLSAAFSHPSVTKRPLYSVEFSLDHPPKLKHVASSHAVKVRDFKESKAVTNSLHRVGKAAQSLAHRFDEDSFLGRALTRTAQHIQRSLQRQKFNQSKREREVAMLSMQRSSRDRQMYSLRREQSQRWDDDATQRQPSVRLTGSHALRSPPTSTPGPSAAAHESADSSNPHPSGNNAPAAQEFQATNSPEAAASSPSIDSRTATVVHSERMPTSPAIASTYPESINYVAENQPINDAPTLQRPVEASALVANTAASSYEVELPPPDITASTAGGGSDDVAHDATAAGYDISAYNDASAPPIVSAEDYSYQDYATSTDTAAYATQSYDQQVYNTPSYDQSAYTPQSYHEHAQGTGYALAEPSQDYNELGYDLFSYGQDHSGYSYGQEQGGDNYGQEQGGYIYGQEQGGYSYGQEQGYDDHQSYDQQSYYYQPDNSDHRVLDATEYVGEGVDYSTAYAGDAAAPAENEWQEAYDPTSGQLYYYNSRTGESVWQQ